MHPQAGSQGSTRSCQLRRATADSLADDALSLLRKWAAERPGWRITSMFLTASNFTEAAGAAGGIARFLQARAPAPAVAAQAGGAAAAAGASAGTATGPSTTPAATPAPSGAESDGAAAAGAAGASPLSCHTSERRSGAAAASGTPSGPAGRRGRVPDAKGPKGAAAGGAIPSFFRPSGAPASGAARDISGGSRSVSEPSSEAPAASAVASPLGQAAASPSSRKRPPDAFSMPEAPASAIIAASGACEVWQESAAIEVDDSNDGTGALHDNAPAVHPLALSAKPEGASAAVPALSHVSQHPVAAAQPPGQLATASGAGSCNGNGSGAGCSQATQEPLSLTLHDWVAEAGSLPPQQPAAAGIATSHAAAGPSALMAGVASTVNGGAVAWQDFDFAQLDESVLSELPPEIQFELRRAAPVERSRVTLQQQPASKRRRGGSDGDSGQPGIAKFFKR